MRASRAAALGLVAVSVVLLLVLAPAWAQDAAVRYVYDDLGRLIAVVDQQGNVATYAYDLVGNLLAVERVAADGIPGPLGITLVTPNRGQVGTGVQIFGKGFSATPTSDAVRFNGTLATVTEAAPNRLLTSVPPGATTGSITVTVGANTATSPSPFTVGSALAVTPPTGTVWVNGTLQFQATEGGTPTTAVTWAVNGITGGGPVVGTISTGGLYTAPVNAPQDSTVTITATQVEDRSSTASATATVLKANIDAARATNVSAGFADAGTVNQNLTATVSAALGDPATTFAISSNVSAALAESPATLQASPGVTSSWEPVITSVTPASGARGATSVSISLTGVGLAAATQLSFLAKVGSSWVADTNITVTDLTAMGDGTLATATISVGSSAVLGGHVVQIQVAGATSTRDGTGTNVFTVNP